jgi:hypothetical protein
MSHATPPSDEASPSEGTAAITPRSRLKLTLSQFWSVQVAIIGVAIIIYGAYRDLKDDIRSFKEELRHVERAVGVRPLGDSRSGSDDSSAVPINPPSRPALATVVPEPRSTP